MYYIERYEEPLELIKNRKRKTKVYRTEEVVSTLYLMCPTCYICNCSLSGGDTIEHVFPQIRNPLRKLEWENLILCCSKCNNSKRAKEGEVINPTSNMYDLSKIFKYDILGYMDVNYKYIYRDIQNVDNCRNIASKARNTIDYYDLNRRLLINERHEKILKVVNAKSYKFNKKSNYNGMILAMKEQLERLGVKYE